MIQLGDRDCLDIVLKDAQDYLKGDDYLTEHGYRYEDGQVLFDLIQAYSNPDFRESVIAFINQSFSFSKTYAKENKEYDYLSGDPDSSILLVICQAISLLNKGDREQFTRLVFDIYKFSSFDERSYATNQASGYIALLLTDYEGVDIEVVNNSIEVTGEHYQTNAFVHQTLYCRWILTKDIDGALSYLKLEENRKGFIYAITALVDLNYKEALPMFESMMKEEKHPVFIEVLKEAIARLNLQNAIPETKNRMIWMSGSLTPTQRALGAQPDNVFVTRAQEKMDIDDNVYETDDD